MSMSVMRPRTRTTSISTMEHARGTHEFVVDGYSLHRGLGVGRFVRSATFGVGGYDWSIRFYPAGERSSEDYADYVAVFLELMSTDVAEVMASFDLWLVDQSPTGQHTVLHREGPKAFTSDATKNPSAVSAWGRPRLKKRSELEAPSSAAAAAAVFLRDDCLVIECDVTVLNKATTAAAIDPGSEVVGGVQVPPSDLSDNLRTLLEEKHGADVTFKVRDEVFPAHKIVLAMRSPVFRAELLGPMAAESTSAAAGGGQRVITVEDMQPDVFRALLQFVYTDTRPPVMDELEDARERKEMLKHLLVAADRYAMERLKLICEAFLCESMGVEDVAAMAALADWHRCEALGRACAEFLASSNRIDDVVESPGYVQLKKECPAVLVDMLERVAKCIMQRGERDI